jgi:hypothetical protein
MNAKRINETKQIKKMKKSAEFFINIELNKYA